MVQTFLYIKTLSELNEFWTETQGFFLSSLLAN